jgi:hypothetical protein
MGAAVVLKTSNSRTQKHCIGIDTTDSEQSLRVKVRFISCIFSLRFPKLIKHQTSSFLIIQSLHRWFSGLNPKQTLKTSSQPCALCNSFILNTCCLAGEFLLLPLINTPNTPHASALQPLQFPAILTYFQPTLPCARCPRRRGC